MIVLPPPEWELLPDKHPTSSIEELLLLKAIADRQLSIKEILESLMLKDRENLMASYLNPAIESGLVERLYPDKPRHPRQKYRLTAKGLIIYNSLPQ